MQLTPLLGAVTIAGALVMGILMGLMRGKPSLPAVVRYFPLMIVGAVVLGWLGLGVLGIVTAFGAVEGVDAANKATVLAQGISEAMNCTVASGIIALTFSAGLIVTLIVTRRRPPLASLARSGFEAERPRIEPET